MTWDRVIKKVSKIREEEMSGLSEPAKKIVAHALVNASFTPREIILQRVREVAQQNPPESQPYFDEAIEFIKNYHPKM